MYVLMQRSQEIMGSRPVALTSIDVSSIIISYGNTLKHI